MSGWPSGVRGGFQAGAFAAAGAEDDCAPVWPCASPAVTRMNTGTSLRRITLLLADALLIAARLALAPMETNSKPLPPEGGSHSRLKAALLNVASGFSRKE